jgi:hypothetical protein
MSYTTLHPSCSSGSSTRKALHLQQHQQQQQQQM